MNRQFKQISLLTIFIAHLSLAQVDVVVSMKNGDRISGQWRGGGEREIRLQVGNQRMNFQVSEVESVAFAAARSCGAQENVSHLLVVAI